jgi:MGT family glycosyltransferase
MGSAIGLALTLMRMGHEVGFVADASWIPQLEKQGITRIPRGTKDGPSFQTTLWAQPFSAAIQVKHVEYAIEKFYPDVLLGQQLALGPNIAALRANLPLAILGFSTWLWPNSLPRKADAPQQLEPAAHSQRSDAERVTAWRYATHLDLFNQLQSAFHVKKSDSWLNENPLLGHLFMLRSTPAFAGNIESLPTVVQSVGPCLWEEENTDPELEQWLTDAEENRSPIIYVQQGRFFDRPHFWPKLVEAFQNTTIRVVASTGDMDCPVGILSSNFFVRQSIPQSRVLRKARALISSANSTAVLGALVAGIPALLIPAGGEQPDVAERCRQLGVARVLLPGEVTPDRLKSELTSLFEDDSLYHTVKRLSVSFSKMNDFKIAASLLETLAQTKKPVFREMLALEESA